VLELACGDAPYVEALLQAGADYTGLDQSAAMLAFAEQRVANTGMAGRAHFYQGRMEQFQLPYQVDLAFILMGSLQYVAHADLLGHLDCVAAHVRSGGIYLLEWCIEFQPSPQTESTWSEDSPYGEIEVYYARHQISALRQEFREELTLRIAGEVRASSQTPVYLRYPNEFALLLQQRSADWTLIGHFQSWDLAQPLSDEHIINRPICVLRRE
jgi:cyclopropane fatty-acyl-phospholipid synthase-like methyltransferase